MKRIMDLNENWQFREVGMLEWLPAKIPGCVQLDLMALGLLDDPYTGTEKATHAIEDKEWEYRCLFDLSEPPDQYETAMLTLNGLDTYAEISLNGKFLCKTENALIPHRLNCKAKLRQGENLLGVRFASTKLMSAALHAEDGGRALGYVCDPDTPYVRRAHYSTGWDWSPRIMHTGIWRSVTLELRKGGVLRDPRLVLLDVKSGIAHVLVEARIEGDFAGEPKIAIRCEGKPVAQSNASVSGDMLKAELLIPDAQFWQPSGMGEQPLYEVCITLPGQDEVSFQTGLRTIKILQEPDEQGEKLIVEINGRKVFCKGANWIPADCCPSRITYEKLDGLLRDAKNANMNMLMMWGGGYYESPEFYELCDKYGIMLWQTFMFHWLQPPDYLPWMKKLMLEEVRSVVLELRNHPSVVIWCGECECLWAFGQDLETPGNRSYLEDFPKICKELDGTRPYRPGNPYGGEDPNDMNIGDRHSYESWLQWQDVDVLFQDNSRFLSEFGASSMPTWKTLCQYTPESERRLLSFTGLNRNKLPEGNERLGRYLLATLGWPKDFRSFCYMTQYNQAQIMKTAIERFRTRMFDTAGTLFWMFTDCWPGASWSCIDYYGRKKALWYAARKFYAPIVPVLHYIDDKLELVIANDGTATPARISIEAYDLGGELLWSWDSSVTLAENAATRLDSISPAIPYKEGLRVSTINATLGTSLRKVNLAAWHAAYYVTVETDAGVFENAIVPARLRELELPIPRIVAEQSGKALRLISSKPAFGVFVEPENDVQPSDNGFYLRPGVWREITFTGEPGNVELFDLASMRVDWV